MKFVITPFLVRIREPDSVRRVRVVWLKKGINEGNQNTHLVLRPFLRGSMANQSRKEKGRES